MAGRTAARTTAARATDNNAQNKNKNIQEELYQILLMPCHIASRHMSRRWYEAFAQHGMQLLQQIRVGALHNVLVLAHIGIVPRVQLVLV